MIENPNDRKSGIGRNGLRAWGMILIVLGVVSVAIIQRVILGINDLSGLQLLELMQGSSEAMTLATIALVMQMISTCAIPIFAFLLVEGFLHTSRKRDYFLRVLALALFCEIPYNLAYSGEWIHLGSRNPVFALVICIAMLYLYQQYAGKSVSRLLTRFLITIMAVAWVVFFCVSDGLATVVIVAVLWMIRKRPIFRDILGASAAIGCTMFSLYYLPSAIAFLFIHFYNGEKGESNRLINYVMYPMILIAACIAGLVLK